MSKLDIHISELLYDHECVIVPDLGGFLSSYSPARIHDAQHMVMPPSKKIAFNVFLRQNDGLLANYLVRTERVSYPEALRDIENYVELCNRELNAGKKFVIEKVGTLTRDMESNIQFEAFNNVNFLKDSFGFSPVQFIPVHHNDFEEKVEKQLREFISLRPSQAQPRQPVAYRKSRLNPLNTMLLAGSILWFCLNLYIVSPDNINFASLNPFSVSTGEQPVKNTVSVEENPEIYTQPSVAKTETVYVKTAKPVEAIPDNDHSAAGVKNPAPNFFIIAGAFSSQENAKKKVAELKTQGFIDACIIQNNEGLNLVCYDGFATREEAVDSLSRMKASDRDGWIFPR